MNLIFSLAFFIFLYKFIPLYTVTALGKSYPVLQGRIAFNAADGLIRIAIFLAFLFGVGASASFAYSDHGARHTAVRINRIGTAGYRQKCADVHHVSSTLRDQLPAGSDYQLP